MLSATYVSSDAALGRNAGRVMNAVFQPAHDTMWQNIAASLPNYRLSKFQPLMPVGRARGRRRLPARRRRHKDLQTASRYIDRHGASSRAINALES